MAKNRRIPFSYQMIKGEIVTEPKEVYAVSKIFVDYLKGKSMLEILTKTRNGILQEYSQMKASPVPRPETNRVQ